MTKSRRTRPKEGPKNYVLDTSVLIYEPMAIFKFEENHVHIPAAVLEELDGIKTEQASERGRQAREVHRILMGLFKDHDSTHKGVLLENSGRVFLALPNADVFEKIGRGKIGAVLRDSQKRDNHIIMTALMVRDANPPPTILVTKDANVALKARALGLAAEDYRNDKLDAAQSRETSEETEVVQMSDAAFQAFLSEKGAENEDASFKANDYLIVRSESGQEELARASSPRVIRPLSGRDHVLVDGGRRINAKDHHQRFLLDALFDPDITLVTIQGKAGTGKTLLAISAALRQLSVNGGPYDRVLISRPIVPMGNDIGFLPGGVEDKVGVYMTPYYDALDFLFSPRAPVSEKFANKPVSRRKDPSKTPTDPNSPFRPYQPLINQGRLQIEPLTYIRGRSIAGAFLLVDEAANLTRHEIQGIITRMSHGSKLVLMGDPNQIDAPYLDKTSNGLTQTAARMNDLSYAAHISLVKGFRSKMAEDAAQRL